MKQLYKKRVYGIYFNYEHPNLDRINKELSPYNSKIDNNGIYMLSRKSVKHPIMSTCYIIIDGDNIYIESIENMEDIYEKSTDGDIVKSSK
jgi:hypothetical protein